MFGTDSELELVENLGCHIAGYHIAVSGAENHTHFLAYCVWAAIFDRADLVAPWLDEAHSRFPVTPDYKHLDMENDYSYSQSCLLFVPLETNGLMADRKLGSTGRTADLAACTPDLEKQIAGVYTNYYAAASTAADEPEHEI